MMQQTQYRGSLQKSAYRIAGLLMEVTFPEGLDRRKIMPSFEPFLVSDVSERCICSIELAFVQDTRQEDEGKLLSDVSVVWGERFRFFEQDDCYITTIWNENNDGVWKMKSSKDFSSSVIYTLNDEQSVYHAFTWLIMVAFGQTCLWHRTILIHASVIAHEERGYVFLGKSGTGKSTHSRLWLEYIESTELLNDDNPAIRLEDDGLVYVYGTPWSGKTSCYKNRRVQLQAFVRLKQASHNQLFWKTGAAAVVCVLPSCTAIRWNKQLFAGMTDTVEAMIRKVPVAELACLPDQAAARLCFSEISNITLIQSI